MVNWFFSISNHSLGRWNCDENAPAKVRWEGVSEEAQMPAERAIIADSFNLVKYDHFGKFP